NTVHKIEKVIRPSEKIPENLAWMIESGAVPRDSIFPFLKMLLKNNPNISGCVIAYEPYSVDPERKYYAPFAYYNKQGKIDTSFLGGENLNYFLRDWYQIPLRLQKNYWTEPYFAEGGGDIFLTSYSVPFYKKVNGKRKVAGVITIDISLDWLTDIVNSVEILETGYAFLLSGNGVYVTHPDRSNIMNETIFTRAKELDEPKMREVGRDMISGKSNLRSVDLKDIGKVLVYHTPLPSTKWSLGVVYPRDEIFASLHQLTWLLVLLTILGLVVLTVVTVRSIKGLTRPLSQFAQSARVIAEGNFNIALPDTGRTEELKELRASFDFMQQELDNYIVHLKKTTSAKEKIESELRIAKEIQMGMIPHIFPPFPNMNQIDLFARLEPAKEVGGDLYDFFMIDDTHLCFAIGDVSGKGVPASLFMAVTRTLLRSLAPKQRSPKKIADALNNSLAQGNESSMFVTFFLGILDIETGELKYTNAGHNPPILMQDGNGTEYFEITKDIPVGLFEDYNYTEMERTIRKNDRIFFYTDGITEAENLKEELYSDEKLLHLLTSTESLSPAEIINVVEQDVKTHVGDNEQSDDLTMMCVIYYGK
ncbi:MAG TPA: SpoIIE family protein phosphatase, partial [Bacteroidales bacterium]|nr:SpoIIE family protein phosphatase [Bacteroidales bacterium]